MTTLVSSPNEIRSGSDLTYIDENGRTQRFKVTSIEPMIGSKDGSYVVGGLWDGSTPITFRLVTKSRYGPTFTNMTGRKQLGHNINVVTPLDHSVPTVSIEPITPYTDLKSDDVILGSVMFTPGVWTPVDYKVKYIQPDGYIIVLVRLEAQGYTIGFSVDQTGNINLVYDRKVFPTKDLIRRRVQE
jgi:hypothetical protein